SSSLEMVLVDEKGGKMHATVRKQLIYMFDFKLEEGQIYEMSYFAVFPQSGFYRTTLHPYKLVFQIKTKARPSESSAISELGLSFNNLAEFCSHTHDYKFLVGK
ncbi:replication factor A protein, partial [Trifolium medium]|nr:replication factor A protein [Trifolium medium]